MRKATLKDIKEGNFLYMQNEPDIKSGFYYWGYIGRCAIPRLKRQIRLGTYLWWIKGDTRTTAARLDRFEKADRWGQRRVEEGFVVNAACVATNNVLVEIKLLTISLEKNVMDLLDNSPVKIINSERGEKMITKAILDWWECSKPFINRPWYMAYRSSINLTAEHKQILDSFESDESFNRHMLNKFYYELLGANMVTIADAAEMLRLDDIEYFSEKESDRCEHDLPKHICAVCNWVDEPILTNIPQGLSVDESLRQGIRENAKPSKGYLHSMTMNDKPFDVATNYDEFIGRECPESFAVAVRNLGRETLKAFESMLKKSDIYKNHFAETRILICHGRNYNVTRFPFEPNWLLRKRIMKAIKGIDRKAKSMRF